MAAGWTSEETKALIACWGEANVQEQLDSVKRNRDIYERIAAEMAKQGFHKAWKQCRVKVKNLTQRYRKTKDHNGVSGRGRRSCPFYEEINAILGTRAASQPPVVLDCGNEGGMEVPVEIGDEQEGDLENLIETGESSTTPAPDPSAAATSLDSSKATSGEGDSADKACSSGETITEDKKSTAEPRKGVKRKASKRDSDLKETIHLLGKLDKEAEERYEEREHKRMMTFLDAEERRRRAFAEEQERLREQERRHEQQMQCMFMSFMNQMMTGGAGQGYPTGPRYPLASHPTAYPPSTAHPYSSSTAYPPNLPTQQRFPVDSSSSSAYPNDTASATGPAYPCDDTSPTGPFSPHSFYEPSP